MRLLWRAASVNGIVTALQIREQIEALKHEHANGMQQIAQLEANLERATEAVANISGAVIALEQLLKMATTDSAEEDSA